MGKQEPDPKPLDDSNSTNKPKSNPNTSLVDVPAPTDMAKSSIPSSLLPQPSWFTAKRYSFSLTHLRIKAEFCVFTNWVSKIS